jgi:hypothetical protein
MPKLSALYLYGNPLQCDYQLQEVWRWCQEHNIRTDFQLTWEKCDKRIWWGVLEKRHCLQDILYSYLDYKDSSYSYEAYEDPHGDKFSYKHIYSFLQRYATLLYVVPFRFGTTGNVIILIIITCNKDMRTVPNMYILNLAISDMICLMVQFAEPCVDRISDTWQYDDFTCRFFPVLPSSVSRSASVLCSCA